MTITPPEGSKISVLTTDIDAPTIVIPMEVTAMGYLHVIFVRAWFVACVALLTMFVTKFIPGVWSGADAPSSGISVFVLGLIAGVIARGVYIALPLSNDLRPAVPASLRLAQEGIDFDSGIQPTAASACSIEGRNMPDNSTKRIRRKLDRGQLKSMRLRQFETGSRLTVDVENERIEIARGATDVECEWLFRLLVDRYQLKTDRYQLETEG